ncbi:MAG: molybdenum cofactor biosynthesis protein MoaE [Candidatus Njordarchaeales archaeon]
MKVGIIRDKKYDFSKLLQGLKSSENIWKCGAIVSFIGMVRGVGRDGSKVKKLVYEAADEIVIKELNEIRREILEKYEGVHEVLIYHFVGEREVGEDTIYILVASEHREEGFKAARETLELVKERVHIWKKEITEKGAYWIMGEEQVKVENSKS